MNEREREHPTAPTPVVPSWIEVRRGTAPLLLFAPHGARRTLPRRPGRDNVNDLHTADVTRELGTACDATWIVNESRDRNELDLNRTQQVRERAPWLLEFLAATLEEMVAAHGGATLLAVHGWNVVQCVCDLGVGLVEEHGVCRPAARGHATVSQAFLRDRLRVLQRRAHARGVLVTIGARYPAAHASNVMQLLTARHADDPEPLLRRLATLAERGAAGPHELGIPLRWRGPQRAAFVETLVDVLTASPTAGVVPLTGDDTHAATLDRRAETTLTVPVLGCGGKPTTRVGMQVASGPVAVFGSIDAGPAGATAGRLLITDAAERLALFTGELVERGPSLHVPALCIEADDDDALDVRFAGPMLAFPVLTPFTDLERGLAAGTLIDADVTLRFTAIAPRTQVAPGGARFGIVRGIVHLGDARHRLEASGAATEGLPPTSPRPNVRLVLPGTVHGDLDLRSHSVTDVAGDPSRPFATAFRFEIEGVAWSGPRPAPVRGIADVHLGDATLRVRVADRDDRSDALEATLERPIPVRRPGPAGTVVETVFALCRIANAPTGWLELTVDRGADDD